MEEIFKEQLKKQIEVVDSEISKRIGVIKRIKSELGKLRTEKASMNRLLTGKKTGRPKKKEETKDKE